MTEEQMGRLKSYIGVKLDIGTHTVKTLTMFKDREILGQEAYGIALAEEQGKLNAYADLVRFFSQEFGIDLLSR